MNVITYFLTWITLAVLAMVLNILNIDWDNTLYWTTIPVVIILALIQSSVLEIVVQTILTMIIGGHLRENKKQDAAGLTLLMNYNLLASDKQEIDECMKTMFEAFMGNLSPNIAAVLVSATKDEKLKAYEIKIRDRYRSIIYDELYSEGIAFTRKDYNFINPLHLEHIWNEYKDVDKTTFYRKKLKNVCIKYANKFMVIHRISKVLRKCGQYQDLILLSEGVQKAYTYCDPEYYGRSCRKKGEPLFEPSDDVVRIKNHQYDYTLVLDMDSGVPTGMVYELLQIAAAHPERGIIQPAIDLKSNKLDTIFMHLESMKQNIYEPMTNAIAAVLGQSSFFGKGLLKNSIYHDYIIGHEDSLVERVPIDVLSHDTFEAAILKPLYAGSVHLTEAPAFNYIAWSIRERRWNRGEIILAMYFWKNVFGRPMRFLQKTFQREKFNETKLRTETKFDFVSSYIAHSALRQMIMKPLLFIYIMIHIQVKMRHPYAPIAIIMFFILVFPKFVTCNRNNLKYVILETLASFLQFTPESVVGCVRICRALQATIWDNCHWVPQRTIENEFMSKNPFLTSFRHLGGYTIFAIAMGAFAIWYHLAFGDWIFLILVMLSTLVVLPMYTGITSLPAKFTPRYNTRASKVVSTTLSSGLGFKYFDSPGSLMSLKSVDSQTSLISNSDSKSRKWTSRNYFRWDTFSITSDRNSVRNLGSLQSLSRENSADFEQLNVPGKFLKRGIFKTAWGNNGGFSHDAKLIDRSRSSSSLSSVDDDDEVYTRTTNKLSFHRSRLLNQDLLNTLAAEEGLFRTHDRTMVVVNNETVPNEESRTRYSNNLNMDSVVSLRSAWLPHEDSDPEQPSRSYKYLSFPNSNVADGDKIRLINSSSDTSLSTTSSNLSHYGISMGHNNTTFVYDGDGIEVIEI